MSYRDNANTNNKGLLNQKRFRGNEGGFKDMRDHKCNVIFKFS
jgi:hypothetical protein